LFFEKLLHEGSVTDKKILIIDDEPSFVELIVEYFKIAGYDARTALNLEDAIQVFRSQKPRVVLLDFNMPMVTGEKFLPILQNLNPSVRVIVITGCLEQEVEMKFKGLGYFGFFEKGNLSLEKLRQKVDEAFVG
jgi:DNA-binding NtrC family response regulator